MMQNTEPTQSSSHPERPQPKRQPQETQQQSHTNDNNNNNNNDNIDDDEYSTEIIHRQMPTPMPPPQRTNNNNSNNLTKHTGRDLCEDVNSRRQKQAERVAAAASNMVVSPPLSSKASASLSFRDRDGGCGTVVSLANSNLSEQMPVIRNECVQQNQQQQQQDRQYDHRKEQRQRRQERQHRRHEDGDVGGIQFQQPNYQQQQQQQQQHQKRVQKNRHDLMRNQKEVSTTKIEKRTVLDDNGDQPPCTVFDPNSNSNSNPNSNHQQQQPFHIYDPTTPKPPPPPSPPSPLLHNLHLQIHHLQHTISTHLQTITTLRRDTHHHSIQSSALRHSLSAAQHENRTLSQTLQRTRTDLTSATTTRDSILSAAHEENARLRAHAEELDAELRRRITRVAVLEQEVRRGERRVGELEGMVEGMEGERRGWGEAVERVRREGEGGVRMAVELQQGVARAEADVVVLRGVVGELEGERDALRGMVREEAGRAGRLEEALVGVQEREVVAQEEIRRLAREKAQLLTRVNEADARLMLGVVGSGVGVSWPVRTGLDGVGSACGGGVGGGGGGGECTPGAALRQSVTTASSLRSASTSKYSTPVIVESSVSSHGLTNNGPQGPQQRHKNSFDRTQWSASDNHAPPIQCNNRFDNYINKIGNPQLSAIPKHPLSERDINIINSKEDDTFKGGGSHKILSKTPILKEPIVPMAVTTAPSINPSPKATDAANHPLPEPNSLLDYLVSGAQSSPLLSCKKSLNNERRSTTNKILRQDD